MQLLSTYYFEVGAAEAIYVHTVIIDNRQSTELVLLKT